MAENKSERRGHVIGGGGPHGAAMMATAKAKDFKGSGLRLLKILKPYHRLLALVLFFNVAATFLSAIAPKVMAGATNEIARGALAALSGGVGIDFTLVAKIMAVFFACYILSAWTGYAVQYILAGVTQRAMYDLRRQIDQKLLKLPLKYFDSHPYGDTLSRTTNDVDTIANSLQQSLNQAVESALSVVLILIMMLTISPLLTFLGLITLPLGAFCSACIIKFSQKFFKGQQRALGDLNGYIEETYNGHDVVKAYCREEKAKARFAEVNNQLYSYACKAQFCSGIMMPFVMFFTNIGYIIVSCVGAVMAISGRLLVGDIQAVIQYMRQISHPVSMVANIANVLQSAVAAAERIFELLDEKEELVESENPTLIEKVEGEVRIENLSFGYSPDKPVLKNISTWAKRGQSIAIVGPTGSGKTTLVNLLLRFYEPDSGSITIDGVDIRDMPRSHLRGHFGMVLQDTWLFKGSIMENIRYGKTGATDEQVISAAKSAYVHRFVTQLPNGYDFMLNEDASNISQGQRQLITIARVLLADPDILILDEATSSVDTRTEVLIQKAMDKLMKGRTTFVIAHRLSTIREAQAILVVKDGEIIERGNHEQLIAQNGFYCELYNSQFAS